MDPSYVWQPRVKFQDRGWVHVLLFMITLATTTWAGAIWYAGFIEAQGRNPLDVPFAWLYLRGFWYSGTVLAILGCHELGHYLACRYYDVDASLPFFLPFPPVLTGTLGAFIRIREPIPRKRMLFDIGIAGPIAGFLVTIPALFIGMAMSTLSPLPTTSRTVDAFGEPLAFRLAQWAIFGSQGNEVFLNLHPVGFAAWFGLLATALNLFPMGQLDGGHISYAVLGRRSTYVTLATIVVAMGLSYLSVSWIIWTALAVGMLIAFGFRHPHVYDEHVPLDRARIALAVVAALIFAACFTARPIYRLEINKTNDVSSHSRH